MGGGRWGPSRQPAPSPEPEQSAGRWVPSGPPPQVPHPTPSGSDVGQLITTLASGLLMGTLKSILLVVTLPLVKQRYHLNNGTTRFGA